MSNVVIDGLDNVIIIVRFSEKNFKFVIPYTTSIVDLKEKIKEKEPGVKDKYLRLIYKGRVLKDDKCLNDYNIVADTTDEESGNEHENEELKALNGEDSLKQYVIHCVASNMSDHEENNSEPQMQQTIGFDRLLGLGLPQEEVDALRRQFHLLRHTYDMDTEEGRQLEEEWLNAQRGENDNQLMMSQNDFLIGLLIGLFGGLIAFLFRESISRKKIFGLYCGIALNIIIGIQRLWFS